MKPQYLAHASGWLIAAGALVKVDNLPGSLVILGVGAAVSSLICVFVRMTDDT